MSWQAGHNWSVGCKKEKLVALCTHHLPFNILLLFIIDILIIIIIIIIIIVILIIIVNIPIIFESTKTIAKILYLADPTHLTPYFLFVPLLYVKFSDLVCYSVPFRGTARPPAAHHRTQATAGEGGQSNLKFPIFILKSTKNYDNQILIFPKRTCLQAPA